MGKTKLFRTYVHGIYVNNKRINNANSVTLLGFKPYLGPESKHQTFEYENCTVHTIP